MIPNYPCSHTSGHICSDWAAGRVQFVTTIITGIKLSELLHLFARLENTQQI